MHTLIFLAEQTMVFQEVFSMISNLIGPQKWILLAKALKVYPEEQFDQEIKTLEKRYRKTPDRIWACLTHWRLGAGKSAQVTQIITALKDIQIFWLAGKLYSNK